MCGRPRTPHRGAPRRSPGRISFRLVADVFLFVNHGRIRVEKAEQVDRSQRAAIVCNCELVELEVAIVRVAVSRIELAHDLARVDVHLRDVPGVTGREVRPADEELPVRGESKVARVQHFRDELAVIEIDEALAGQRRVHDAVVEPANLTRAVAVLTRAEPDIQVALVIELHAARIPRDVPDYVGSRSSVDVEGLDGAGERSERLPLAEDERVVVEPNSEDLPHVAADQRGLAAARGNLEDVPVEVRVGELGAPGAGAEEDRLAVGRDGDKRGVGSTAIQLGQRSDWRQRCALPALLDVDDKAVERDDSPVMGEIEHREERSRFRVGDGDLRIGRRVGSSQRGTEHD